MPSTDALFSELPPDHPLYGTDLELSPDEVASLTPQQREERVERLIDLAVDLVEYAEQVHGPVVARVGLFSGGNDSTTMMHVLHGRGLVTHAAHANTGIGIERTRQFVRDTCAEWGIELIEKSPDEKDSYRSIVIDQGFPGPGHHYKMYQRLKERALRKVTAELKTHRLDRVMYLAGRRRTESARRANVPEMQREGSVVWVSPIVLWTALDMNTYRDMAGDVPRNEVSDLIHMSGECLCGAFAAKNELAEIAMWFPEVAEEIHELEAEVRAAGHQETICRWGWGADNPNFLSSVKAAKSGPMCSSCDNRLQESLFG